MESSDTFRGVATRPSPQRFRPAAIAFSSWVILSAGAGGLACNVVLGIDDATLCGDCDGGAPVLEARTPLSPPDSASSSGDPPGSEPPGSEPPGSAPPGPLGTGADGAAPSGPGPAAMTGTSPGAPTAPALPPEPIDSSSGSATPDAGPSEDDTAEDDTAEDDGSESNACTPGTTRCIDASTVGACDTTGQVEISIGCGLLEGCQAGVCSLLGL